MRTKMIGDEYRLRSKPDMVEGAKNRMHTTAMQLYRLITEDLRCSDFTVDDIIESYNALTETGIATESGEKEREMKQVRYGKKHLDYLVNQKLLSFEPSTKEYLVDSLTRLEQE